MNIRLTSALFMASIGIALIVPQARADEWNKQTFITVSGQINVAGTVLDPGTYVFRLVDVGTGGANRHIVQIQNRRQNHTFATVLAIPDYRVRPTGRTVFTFYETPAGQPPAVKDWFYPGDNFGQEFRYRPMPGRVAQVTTTNQATEEAAAAPLPPPVVAENTPPPPPPAPEQAPEEVTPAPAPEPAPVAPAPAVIPQTASELPLFALLGFGSLGLALGVRILAKRIG